MNRRVFTTVIAGGLTRIVFGQQRKAKRVYALIGDRYHNSDYIRVALEKIYGDMNLVVDYTTLYDKLSAAALKDYDMFLCLRDGMIWPGGYLGPDAYTGYAAGLENSSEFPQARSEFWMKEEQAVAIKEFVDRGGAFYSVHNNSHVSVTSKTFREVQGGAYLGHPSLRPFKVHITNTTHPIAQGISDFVVNDEQHYVAYDKDPKYQLLEAENVDGLKWDKYGTKSVAGWAYDFGRGRVVFTSVGHTIHALWNPEYVKLQRRAAQWLLKEI